MTKAKTETKKNEKENTTKEAAAAPAPNFKVKRRVTLPLLKIALDKPVFLRIEDKMFTGKAIEKGGKQMEAATLMNCTDLSTGEMVQIICNKVLESIMTEEYEDKGTTYVGLSFMLTKHPKASGKDYHTFTVVEIEVED